MANFNNIISDNKKLSSTTGAGIVSELKETNHINKVSSFFNEGLGRFKAFGEKTVKKPSNKPAKKLKAKQTFNSIADNVQQLDFLSQPYKNMFKESTESKKDPDSPILRLVNSANLCLKHFPELTKTKAIISEACKLRGAKNINSHEAVAEKYSKTVVAEFRETGYTDELKAFAKTASKAKDTHINYVFENVNSLIKNANLLINEVKTLKTEQEENEFKAKVLEFNEELELIKARFTKRVSKINKLFKDINSVEMLNSNLIGSFPMDYTSTKEANIIYCLKDIKSELNPYVEAGLIIKNADFDLDERFNNVFKLVNLKQKINNNESFIKNKNNKELNKENLEEHKNEKI